MTGENLYSFSELYRHYRACRRNKRNTWNALAFEINAEANLLNLQAELRAHTYRPGRSICFVTDGPKPREVFAADFRDRIVHHLLVWHQERVFEPTFISDSYACRRGKGTLAASDRLMALLRQATANGRRPAWAIKLDVASFFASIHKQTLFDILARRMANPELLWLAHTILFHDPTTDYRFRSLRGRAARPESGRYPIAARKSLFGSNNERGLPIGNLTSQFWGNVYLNELDQYAKRTLKCRAYVRYVDDVVLLSADPAELLVWREQIASFLEERLALRLRSQPAIPFRVSRGVDFVGWRTWPTHRVVRHQTLRTLRRALQSSERCGIAPAFGGAGQRIVIEPSLPRPLRRPVPSIRTGGVARLCETLASYSGHLRHGAAWRDWDAMRLEFPWLVFLFTIDGWRVRARWRASPVVPLPSHARAYCHLAVSAGTDVLVFATVGRYVEFFGPQRVLAQRVLGLHPVPIARFGWGLTAGFPVCHRGRFAQRALVSRIAVVQPLSRSRGAALLVPWETTISSPRTASSRS